MKSQIIVLFILSVLFITAGNSSYAQSDYKIAEQDSLALVAFYHATDGPNWISNQDGFGLEDLSTEWQGIYEGGFNKWLEGPVKDWYGVTVALVQNPNSNESSYRVVKVQPVIGRRTDGQNGLTGYIPREIGLLTALREFFVNGNNGFMDTEIPDEVYHKSLEWLDIESCYFDGDIGEAFRNCTGIKKMNFRYNNIDYLTNWDFLDEAALYNLAGTQWIYSTQIPLSNFEKIIDHFYSISSNPKEFEIQMRDNNNVGDEIEIVAPLGTAVNMECVFAGEHEEFITYQWYKGPLSRFGKTNRFYSITSVKETDYDDYKVKITNDYVKNYDGNTNWGEVYTKLIHLVPEPVAPVVQWASTSYNGKELHLRFSKPMNEVISGFSGFVIQAGSKTIQVKSARTEGRLHRDVILMLDEYISSGDEVSLSYSGNEVADQNGGVLEAISTMDVKNMVRIAPVLVEARTTKDGSGIELEFDNYIDEGSINISDFSILADKNYSIVSGTLVKGEINENISKTVLLTLSQEIISSLEEIKISYSKGELAGLFSGCPQDFSDISVNNLIVLSRTEVKLTVEDGTGIMTDLMIKGSWGIEPAHLFDDGTNGDETAGDNIWTSKLELVDDDYIWEVFVRNTYQTYDTTSVTDPETGVIIQTIKPVTLIEDSVISDIVVLEFMVSNNSVTGTTSFGIATSTLIFNLTADNVEDQIYLMGMDNDWVNGIELEQIESSNIYTVTLSGYSVGEVISYNYRDGNHWENQTAQTRTYTVVAGENVINDSFTRFVSAKGMDDNHIKVFPNPVQNHLNISGSVQYSKLDICNLSGQIIYSQSISSNDLHVDVSNLKAGIYYIILHGNNMPTITQKIIVIN